MKETQKILVFHQAVRERTGEPFLENPEKMEKEMRKIAGTKVGDIFAREIITVQQDTSLDEVATLMAEKKVHTLPVLDGKKLVGVIGKSDIIRTIAQGR